MRVIVNFLLPVTALPATCLAVFLASFLASAPALAAPVANADIGLHAMAWHQELSGLNEPRGNRIMVAQETEAVAAPVLRLGVELAQPLAGNLALVGSLRLQYLPDVEIRTDAVFSNGERGSFDGEQANWVQQDTVLALRWQPLQRNAFRAGIRGGVALRIDIREQETVDIRFSESGSIDRFLLDSEWTTEETDLPFAALFAEWQLAPQVVLGGSMIGEWVDGERVEVYEAGLAWRWR